MTSHYRAMVKELRANLSFENNFRYFLHSTVGVIEIARWNYLLPDYVIVEGEDERRAFRFLVFSEAQIASFPLEVKHKDDVKAAGTIGFKGVEKDDMTDIVQPL